MKVKFYIDEAYPDFSVCHTDGCEDIVIELSESELKEFLEISEKYDSWQVHLRALAVP